MREDISATNANAKELIEEERSFPELSRCFGDKVTALEFYSAYMMRKFDTCSPDDPCFVCSERPAEEGVKLFWYMRVIDKWRLGISLTLKPRVIANVNQVRFATVHAICAACQNRLYRTLMWSTPAMRFALLLFGGSVVWAAMLFLIKGPAHFATWTTLLSIATVWFIALVVLMKSRVARRLFRGEQLSFISRRPVELTAIESPRLSKRKHLLIEMTREGPAIKNVVKLLLLAPFVLILLCLMILAIIVSFL